MEMKVLPNWNKSYEGLLPCVVQSAVNGEVLMLGYMNEASLDKSLESGMLTFFSRSRQKLWMKGERSGNTLRIVSLALDCDQDTFLAQVIPAGPVCHRMTETCFDGGLIYGTACTSEGDAKILDQLFESIELRKKEPLEGSYTAYLLDAGQDKILKKVGEEAAEVIIAAKNMNVDELHKELADLIYHLWVLLSSFSQSPKNIYQVLMERHGKKANLKPPHSKKNSF